MAGPGSGTAFGAEDFWAGRGEGRRISLPGIIAVKGALKNLDLGLFSISILSMMKMMMAIVTPTKAMHCNKDGGILPEGEPESWQGIFFTKLKKISGIPPEGEPES